LNFIDAILGEKSNKIKGWGGSMIIEIKPGSLLDKIINLFSRGRQESRIKSGYKSITKTETRSFIGISTGDSEETGTGEFLERHSPGPKTITKTNFSYRRELPREGFDTSEFSRDPRKFLQT